MWRQVCADKTLAISAPSCAILVCVSLSCSLARCSLLRALTFNSEISSVQRVYAFFHPQVLGVIEYCPIIKHCPTPVPNFAASLLILCHLLPKEMNDGFLPRGVGIITERDEVVLCSAILYVDRTHSITWALLLRAHLGNLGTGTREKRPESDIFRFRAHPRSADLLTSPAIELLTPSYSL